MRATLRKLLLALPAALLLGVGLYFLPPIHQKLAWRVETLYTRFLYTLRPPDQAVFVPQEQPTARLTAPASPPPVALTPSAPAALPSLTSTPPLETPLPVLSPTPSQSPTPLPASVTLTGIRYEYQTFNNCGPANLAMALSFWGWQGDQRDTQAVLRPNPDDANVMPGELLDFVQTRAGGLDGVLRTGGDLDTLRRLLAAGFPVIIEIGHQPSGDWWLGHYVLVSGYDDLGHPGIPAGRLITQDSLILPDLPVPYREVLASGWRDFNYAYLVIFPPQRKAEVLALLGADADPAHNLARTLAKARAEIPTLQGRDLFFGLYNLGSSLLQAGDAPGAAAAFDDAFKVYARLEDRQRPWRVLWYRADPYAAYYATARYADVLALANQTLAWLSKRGLEESHYWRGLAYAALGETDKARADFEISLKLRPTYAEAQAALERLK